MSTPEIEMQNKKSVITLMREVQLTSLINKQNNQVIEAVIDTNEHMVLEEWLYQVAETYFTRTEIVLHTRVIRTTSADEIMDHGKISANEHREMGLIFGLLTKPTNEKVKKTTKF